jgi:hypothetical protein
MEYGNFGGKTSHRLSSKVAEKEDRIALPWLHRIAEQ